MLVLKGHIMLRLILTSAALLAAPLAIAETTANHPGPEAATPQASVPAKTAQLPSAAEIEAALAQMPDMNAIMGDMMDIVKDEDFQDTMKDSLGAFTERLDGSGALEPQDNGMPDFNSLFAVMLGTLSDEETMGGMLETMDEFVGVMEKHAPTGNPKP